MKKLIFSVILQVILLNSGNTAEWNMPTPYGVSSFHTQNVIQFTKEVEEITEGKLMIVVHPASSLIKHAEIKNAVRSAQVPIGEFFLSRLANENALFQLDSIPFVATDYHQAKQLWLASRKVVEAALDKQGLKLLFSVPWPPQGLYSKKKINSIIDIKGLKLRTYNSSLEKLATLFNAVATQVEAADIAQAFATNRVEAMITSPTTGVNSKAWDYLSYYYDIKAWLPKNVIVVNKRMLRRLTPSLRDKLELAGRNAERRGWEASMKETELMLKLLQENGIEVIQPNQQLNSAFKKIGQTMLVDWIKKTNSEGVQIIKQYQQTIKKQKQKD